MFTVFSNGTIIVSNRKEYIMAYEIKIGYPKEETMDNEQHKFVTTSRQEMITAETQDVVISRYNDLQRQGFNVTVAFKTNPDGDEDEVSPFDIASKLTQAGIDYKATLKVKNSSDYKQMLDLANMIEQHGYDFNVDVKMKINDDSSININRESTWVASEDAAFKVTPKASSDDINELKSLFDQLADNGYDVTIDVKPKKQSTDEDDFATQLSVYPDDTTVIFTLHDAEY